MARSAILDAWGRPITRSALTREVVTQKAIASIGQVYGATVRGITPVTLDSIMRSADLGYPRMFLELAETIEERDAHYRSVISTRKNAVVQLDITVDSASDAKDDVVRADMVREWVSRDKLQSELFDILDCISKGFSCTEVIYDTSADGHYVPRLVHRDPRLFMFDRDNINQPMLNMQFGVPEPLEPGHFIFATINTKSGLATRGGLARVVAWPWLFKSYTQRDWAIFTQTFAQPIRLGKFGPSASEADKDTLFNAVSNIAGDCAAIIPESMTMEFVTPPSIGAAHQLYKERCEWLDQQISKAVLGQTSTTDAVVGGLGSGKEHREVQKDIEASDARSLAAILNRDLIQVWMQMEFGPMARYPRLRIGRTEREDPTIFAASIGAMIDRGLEIEQSEIRDRLGLPDPIPAAKLMHPAGNQPMVSPQQSTIAQHAQETASHPAPNLIEDQLANAASQVMATMLGQIEAMLRAAGSFEEFRAMLMVGFPELAAGDLDGVLAGAMMMATATGRADVAGK